MRRAIRYHLVDQPPTNFVGNIKDAPTLLLLHGFPDLWYGWRYRASPPFPFDNPHETNISNSS